MVAGLQNQSTLYLWILNLRMYSPFKGIFSYLKWAQGGLSPWNVLLHLSAMLHCRGRLKESYMSWDSFPCNCMYVAFTLISFVTVKHRPSFLSSPLRHVHTVGGRKQFGRCWFTLKCGFWLPWEQLGRLTHRQIVCVCSKSHPVSLFMSLLLHKVY